MLNKVTSSLLLILFFCVGCATNEPTMTPTAVAVLEENTAVSPTTPAPSHTPQPTLTPEPSQTPTATPTLPPTPTVTPVFSMPSSPIIFVRDDTLQQWNPQTNEFSILTDGVYSWARYSNNIALFWREVASEGNFNLVAFHIPTKSESVIRSLQSQPSVAPNNISYSPPTSITISPDGKWVAYVTDIGTENIPTIFVHKIMMDNEQILTSATNLTFEPSINQLYNIDFTWPTKDHLSWRDTEGIWIVDLNDDPQNATIAIQPSKNTMPFFDCPEDVQPCIRRTTYLPISWSPDGRYLLVADYGYEGGVWTVIEANSNQSFEIPNSYFGVYGDTLGWLNPTTFFQFGSGAENKIWRINANENPFVTLEETYDVPSEIGADFQGVTLLPNGHLRFSASQISGGAANAFYEFDLDSGKLIKLSPDVPQREVSISWSPNKQHVFSRSSFPESTNLLFDLNGSQPIDINSILGKDWCCLYWLEEE